MHEGFTEEINHNGRVFAFFNLLNCFVRELCAGFFRTISDAGDSGHGCTHFQPLFESLHSHRDDYFGFYDSGFAAFFPGLNDGTEFIHAVNIDIVKTCYLGFHVTRHGQINDANRTVATFLDGALNHTQANDGKGGSRTRHNDVEVADHLRQVLQLHGFAVVTCSEVLAAFERTVGHGN